MKLINYLQLMSGINMIYKIIKKAKLIIENNLKSNLTKKNIFGY